MSGQAHEEGPEVSVVIPVYNEATILAEAIEGLLTDLRSAGLDFEVLIAENGSTDQTYLLAEHLGREHPECRCITLDSPDYGRALRAGISSARGRFVICEEIDLCDVSFHLRALESLRAGTELVVGSKCAPGARDQRPFVRRTATRILNALLRFLVGLQGTDTHGPKAFRREVMQPWVEACVMDRDLFVSELVIRAQRAGVSWREEPIILREKRPPSIHLFKRVPQVTLNLLRLTRALGRNR